MPWHVLHCFTVCHLKAARMNMQLSSLNLWDQLEEAVDHNTVTRWMKFGLVSLFNGISTLFRLFNAKAILLEEQYYLTHSWEEKGVHTFPKGICPKVNIIARLENELAYYDSAVHRFNHYTTRLPPPPRWMTKCRTSFKNLNSQATLCLHKSVDSEA